MFGKNNKFLGRLDTLAGYVKQDWWRYVFDRFYVITDSAVIENNEATAVEVELFRSISHAKPNHSILDLCCGTGRHLFKLHDAGYKNLYGVDYSSYLIKELENKNKKLNTGIHFVRGDVRDLSFFDKKFDFVTTFGNSFGYFQNQEDDIQFLQSAFSVLKDDGMFILDILNGDRCRKNFKKNLWKVCSDNYIVCRESELSKHSDQLISREIIIDVDKGVVRDHCYSVRLYSLDEIVRILELVGFEEIQYHQDLVIKEFKKNEQGMMANRMFISARRPSQKRFTVFKVEKAEDLNECRRLANQVFSEELGRPSHGKILHTDTMLACRDNKTKKIVGCSSYAPAISISDSDPVFKLLMLDKMPEQFLKHVAIADMTVVKKEYRKKRVSFLLVRDTILDMIQSGFWFCVSSCEPALLKFHLKINCKPFGKTYKSLYGGHQIPLINDFLDYDFHRKNNTLLLKGMKRIGFPLPKNIEEYKKLRQMLGSMIDK